METKKLIKIGRAIAILSLLLGTVIFVLYYLLSSSFLLFTGYVFVVLAGIINGIFLILVLLRYSKEENYKLHLFVTAGIILLNIPILIFYSWITFMLMDIMRIKFINTTQETLTEINITGCQNKKIKELKTGQSEIVWIAIKGDCTINIEYLIKEKSRKETVMEYATTSMGQKIKYKIVEKKE